MSNEKTSKTEREEAKKKEILKSAKTAETLLCLVGTEDKIGVSFKGSVKDVAKMVALGMVDSGPMAEAVKLGVRAYEHSSKEADKDMQTFREMLKDADPMDLIKVLMEIREDIKKDSE